MFSSLLLIEHEVMPKLVVWFFFAAGFVFIMTGSLAAMAAHRKTPSGTRFGRNKGLDFYALAGFIC
jgi:hypothetical protein